jgi:hypothetical protein
VGGHKLGSHSEFTVPTLLHFPRLNCFPVLGKQSSLERQGEPSVSAPPGEVHVPSEGTRGQSALVLQEIELSSTQRPQEAATGDLVGAGVAITGAFV